MADSKATISERRRERVALAKQWTTIGDGVEVLTVKQVAARLAVSPKTVYEWLADPDASKARTRRHEQRRVCPSCGAATSPPPVGEDDRCCRRCAQREWTPERIVAVLRDARQELRRIPTSTDFHRGHATRRGGSALEFYDRVGLNHAVVARVFGSWSKAIAAAFDDASTR